MLFADATIADPSTLVTTMTTLAGTVTALALGLLGWGLGSKLVRKYLK